MTEDEDAETAHTFLVIMTYAERVAIIRTTANSYAEAAALAAPGLDVIKVEIVSG